MGTLQSIPLPLLVPILVIDLILLVVAMMDLIRAEKANGPKWLWAIIILLIPTFGPILYFIVGRKRDI